MVDCVGFPPGMCSGCFLRHVFLPMRVCQLSAPKPSKISPFDLVCGFRGRKLTPWAGKELKVDDVGREPRCHAGDPEAEGSLPRPILSPQRSSKIALAPQRKSDTHREFSREMQDSQSGCIVGIGPKFPPPDVFTGACMTAFLMKFSRGRAVLPGPSVP